MRYDKHSLLHFTLEWTITFDKQTIDLKSDYRSYRSL